MKEKGSNKNKRELVPNSNKIMFQGNTYILLDVCEKLCEGHTGKKKHSEEEQTPPVNPNEANLSDTLNNGIIQRWCLKGAVLYRCCSFMAEKKFNLIIQLDPQNYNYGKKSSLREVQN